MASLSKLRLCLSSLGISHFFGLLFMCRDFSDSTIFSTISKFVDFAWQLLLHLPGVVVQSWSFLLPIVAFVAFVVHNGSIVVG